MPSIPCLYGNGFAQGLTFKYALFYVYAVFEDNDVKALHNINVT